MATLTSDLPVEVVDVSTLSAHPRNYQQHPEEQIEHLMSSVREHGLYRPLVIARDGTLLAGHGLLTAITRLGLRQAPVVRVDVEPDDPRALKLLVGDNEISGLVERDARALSALLQTLDLDGALLGTGHDETSLSELLASITPSLPVAREQREPVLQSQCLIEIRCSVVDRDEFAPTLDIWSTRDGVTIDVS